MRRSIATVCLSGTLEDKLAAAAAAGFDGVEIFENDLVASPLVAAARSAGARADLGLDGRRCTSRSATSRRSRRDVLRAQPAPGRAQVRR